MDFSRSFYIPDGTARDRALGRTTHLAIGAHADDLEIMAFSAIEKCYRARGKWFGGVTVTSGTGSPRSGAYRKTTNSAMEKIRIREQNRAADVGRYSFVAQLGFSSSSVKTSDNKDLEAQLQWIFENTRPREIFLHNLADKHDTHVAIALASLKALRRAQIPKRNIKVWGCEVWRDLDWLSDDKKGLHYSGDAALSNRLIRCHRSQVSGGKAYDRAVLGRRQAHAVFFEQHRVDGKAFVNFAMDLSPLIRNSRMSILGYVRTQMRDFEKDVLTRMGRFL